MEIFIDHKIARTAVVGFPVEDLLPAEHAARLNGPEFIEDLFQIFNVLAHTTA
jgi:hypothetical protein